MPRRGIVMISAVALALSLWVVSPARGEMVVVQMDHYTVYSDARREVAERFGRHMDKVFAEYRKRFASFEAKSERPMPIYLFAARATYLKALAAHDLDGSNAAGLFVMTPTIQGLFTYLEGKSRAATIDVLEHEGFHQFAHDYLGATLPIWANEGLAQYFEDGILVRGQMMLGQAPAYRLLEVQIALDRKPPLVTFDEVLNMTDEAWLDTLKRDPARSSLLYGYAWSIAHFLIHAGDGRYRDAFSRYLSRVAAGAPSEQAFAIAFETTDTAAMRQRWEEYVRKLTPDPLAEALERMRFLGAALEDMNRNSVPIPAHMRELRDVLIKAQFRASYSMHGVTHVLDATDKSLYFYRVATGSKRMFELLAAARDDLPPRIVATGLKPQPTLNWSRDGDGRLVQEVDFR